MKKVLVSMIAIMGLAGCASYYDYYRGDVRYVQDGMDCIYYAGEYGNRFNADIVTMNTGKKIVYRNTRCSDLFARDNMNVAPRADRVVLAPAARPACGVCAVSACNTCSNAPRRKYIFVPAM